ncbi:MAG TPA: type IV toxin-antitoxin system AbiEi family antitoxin [Anaerolineae bacterium]|nr:type IV toxin-antitoxin system AbiEi family antitoxin [Anaerolineae bacterium]
MAEILPSISIARRLRQSELFYFTPGLLADLLGLTRRQAYRLVARLASDGLADEVEKGKYLLLGLEPEMVLSNPLYIASHLVAPAYVSYWSALHHYGFTEQVPLTTFVATTRQKDPVSYRGLRFHFVAIKPSKFFGYRREDVGALPIVVADEAKAVVDSLDLPQHAGGVGEVARALRAALETVDVPTLIEYANRMENRSLGSRLGYLLETYGRPAEGLAHSMSPVKLEPNRPRTGRTVPRWQIVVNIPENELVDREGVG